MNKQIAIIFYSIRRNKPWRNYKKKSRSPSSSSLRAAKRTNSLYKLDGFAWSPNSINSSIIYKLDGACFGCSWLGWPVFALWHFGISTSQRHDEIRKLVVNFSTGSFDGVLRRPFVIGLKSALGSLTQLAKLQRTMPSEPWHETPRCQSAPRHATVLKYVTTRHSAKAPRHATVVICPNAQMSKWYQNA